VNYYQHNDKGVTQTDVIEWEPPAVDFEFHAGVCVQRGEYVPPVMITWEWQPAMAGLWRNPR
jgi:hypothetical protein